MKNIFIVNPAAGKENAFFSIKEQLETFGVGYDYEIYLTKGKCDATDFVRRYCNEHENEPIRLYACGGDGTLNEVINGAANFKNVFIGCYPCGSGDDFVKYYGGKESFLNIKALLDAEPVKIDLMEVDGKYSVNVTSFGFDTEVVKTMENVKRKPIIGGKNSYMTGVAKSIFTSMKNKCEVFVDGEKINEKYLLLCTVANGNYVGGSFKCAPRSDNTDGLLEVCLFKPVSVFTFLSIMNTYVEGTHLTDERCIKIMKYLRGKSVRVVSPQKEFAYSMDGELVYSNDFTINAVPGAINFLLTAKAKEFRKRTVKTIETANA